MAISISAYANLKRLVAIGNNELWWETDVAAGTMVELTAANGDIDTTDQLNVFEAYQKAFIVNGTNLKVADFANTVLDLGAGNELTTPPGKGDLLTQTGTSATILVDFVDSTKRYIYGYVTSGTFNITGSITQTAQSDDTLDAMSPNPITADLDDVTAGPHWYDWTAFPSIGSTSFGSPPNKAYLGCLYNGRTVVSGNPEAPNQWYMSRQTNPWDWAYVANDAQSPVFGGNGDLGELGDIIRCLAPYKDDYLIFGCSNSVWVMWGDPMAGGSIREVSLTTGIFGANSFCWDSNNKFYFWGNNGLYRTTIPGAPQCISQFKLPRLAKDEAAGPLTHRITLLYDADRHGILVAITVLASGVNSNYWYDLNALDENEIGGFFPETYPSDFGVYSGIYYDSNTPGLKGLVLGQADGFIRTFDDTAKSDTVGQTDNAIDSYVCLGPIAMSRVPRREGVLSGVDLTVAGGGSSEATQANSNDVDFKVYTAKTSEEVLEFMAANVNPNFAGTFTGPGNFRGSTRRQTVRNAYLGVRLQNDTAEESWAYEDLFVHLKDSGRQK